MKALRTQARPLQETTIIFQDFAHVFCHYHFFWDFDHIPFFFFFLDIGKQKYKCCSCASWCFCGKLYHIPISVLWRSFTWTDELGLSAHQLRLHVKIILRWVNRLLFICVNNILVLSSIRSGWTNQASG